MKTRTEAQFYLWYVLDALVRVICAEVHGENDILAVVQNKC
jgi:hypothetical protein